MSAQATVDQIIQAAITRAQEMAGVAQGFSNDAVGAIADAQFQLEQQPSFSGGPTPPVFTGSLDDPTSTFKSDFDAKAGELVDKLATTFAGFLTSHFPRVDACLTAAEQWLCDVINGDWTGIPANVESQIWERSRARELMEARRREEEATAQFAARGFSLPPGALAGQLQEIQQDVANKVSSHGRDVAIKQAEIAVESVKFAVGEALKYRIAAINAAIEYWKAYLLPYDIASRMALAEAEWKKTFYNAALEYYRTQVALYGHDVQLSGSFWDAQLKSYIAGTTAKSALGKARADAATSAAKAAGDIGAAAQSVLSALAQYGYIEMPSS